MTLVSAIMPTRARVNWAAEALSAFLSQTYPAKQLLILDDAEDPSFREPQYLPVAVSYLRTARRMKIPEKRNMLCQLAAGSVLMHFDSDDWSAPGRMADQVERLESSGRSVTGYHGMLFRDVQTSKEYQFSRQNFALGTSLAYTKEWWKAHPFPEHKKKGEDNVFVTAALKAKQLITADAGDLMFARIHAGNTSKKDVRGAHWKALTL